MPSNSRRAGWETLFQLSALSQVLENQSVQTFITSDLELGVVFCDGILDESDFGTGQWSLRDIYIYMCSLYGQQLNLFGKGRG